LSKGVDFIKEFEKKELYEQYEKTAHFELKDIKPYHSLFQKLSDESI
jgi:hypothetical protein